MTTIIISLADDRLVQLNDAAARLGLSPEEVARRGVEEFLERQDRDFRRAAHFVLAKNAELFRPLS